MGFWTNFLLAMIALKPSDRGRYDREYKPVRTPRRAKIVRLSEDEALEHEITEVVEEMKRSGELSDGDVEEMINALKRQE